MDGSPGYEEITGTGRYIYNFDVEFDSENNPVIFWEESYSTWHVYITRWDGTQWTKMDGTPGIEELNSYFRHGSENGLALDGNDNPYLGATRYSSSGSLEVAFMRWDGSMWATMAGTAGAETVFTGQFYGGEPRLLVDDAGLPHLIWRSGSPQSLYLSRWDGSQWVQMDGTPGYEIVAGSDGVGNRYQAVMVPPNMLTLAWSGPDPVHSWLSKFTRWDGSKWAKMDGTAGIDIPAGTEGSSSFIDMDISSTGNPNLLVGAPNLHFIRWDGSKWDGMDGTPGSDHINEWHSNAKVPQLALDSSDNPHVVWQYFLGTKYGIFFRHWNGSSWTRMNGASGIDGISGYCGTSIRPQIEFDAADRPHVAWLENYGSMAYRIAFSYWDGTIWTKKINDCGTAVDCADSNPLIYPGADEICTDGYDNDCDGLEDARDPECPDNLLPIADAGPDQAQHPVNNVSLDGSGSSDPDGNYPLTYSWEITAKPAGSAAAFDDPSSVAPSFVVDIVGTYVAELTVTDALGQASAPDQVVIDSFNSSPVADAGDDQSVIAIGTAVQLDGTDSYDAEMDPFTYAWVFVEKPLGSLAALDDPSLPDPSFTADVHGEYTVSLVVTDIFGAASAQDTVTVSFENVAPVADAGTNQSVVAGDMVYLDGSGSFDANFDPLTYLWNIVTMPEGSGAAITDPTTVFPVFVADLPGEYVVSLIVNDGFIDSDPGSVNVLAVSVPDAATVSLQDLIDAINALADEAFKSGNMRNPLTNKINAVIKMVEDGNYAEAASKLENDILGKTNGCAEAGAPDNNDWLTECESQGEIYPLVIEILELLGRLV